MRVSVLCICALIAAAAAQTSPPAPPVTTELSSVTVPLVLDHNRVVIDVDLPLPDGTTARVHGWVDNGNPDLYFSRRVASLMNLSVSCDGAECSARPPDWIVVSGMRIALTSIKEARIPLKPVNEASVPFPGMNAEVNIPSSVLRNYDVLIDYPDRKFTIAKPGAIHFKGIKNKVQINSANGIIQVPSQIENKKYNLALDLGSSISYLSAELFEKLAGTHPDWPHMSGAVGPVNIQGTREEFDGKLMRLDRVQFGSLFLIDVPVAGFSEHQFDAFKQRAGTASVGLLGADALMNYRVGLDYAHSLVYFDIGNMSKFPEFNVVGITLRPEVDGRFTVVGIADFEGKPSVPGVQVGDHLTAVDGIPVNNSTLGQVWLMLGGSPGQERTLTIERGGKQLMVVANVRHFLGEAPEDQGRNTKRK